MADLSRLSNSDLRAISEGNMAGVSDYGLRVISGEDAQPAQPAQQPAQPMNLQSLRNVAAAITEPVAQMGVIFAEPVAQMGTGLIGSVLGNIGGLAATGAEMISPQGGDPEAFRRYISEGLTYQPRTAGGQFVSQNILAPVGSVIESGAGEIGSIAGALTGSEAVERGAKEAALQGVGFLGVKGGGKVGASAREANLAKMEALKLQKANEALQNKIMKEGQSIGLIAPSTGVVKSTLARFGSAEPYISMKNMTTITNKVGEDVGLAKGAISDIDMATRVKELAGNYGLAEKALGARVPIGLDFKAGVNALLAPMKEKFIQKPETFAALEPSIRLLEEQLKPVVDAKGRMVKQEIPSSVLMDTIRQLRSDARQFNKDTTGNPAIAEKAEAHYKLANLYEDLIDRRLAGKPEILAKFRDSRKKLSKIHIIDAARLPDGLIDPQKLATVVGKYADKRKFVDGNLKIATDFANTFRNVTKPVLKSDLPTASRWEIPMALAGVGGAAHTGGMSLLAASPMMARAIAPTLAERGLLQGKIPSYNLPISRQMMPGIKQGGMIGAGFSPYIKEEQ